LTTTDRTQTYDWFFTEIDSPTLIHIKTFFVFLKGEPLKNGDDRNGRGERAQLKEILNSPALMFTNS